MYDRLLLPVDGSSALEPTITHGLDIAAAMEATVHLLRICPTESNEEIPDVTSSRETAKTVSERVSDIIDERTNDIELRLKHEEDHGPPTAAIGTAIDRINPDLIVMPTRQDDQATPVERSFTEVAATTPLPVLGVPTTATVESAGGYTLFDTILVGTDGSDRSLDAAETAIGFAERYGATLHALYVIDTDGVEQMGTTGGELSVLRAGGQRAIDIIETDGEAVSVPVQTQMQKGTPLEEIIETANGVDADLIVVGAHGERTDPVSERLGGTTEQLISTATRPVLVGK